MVMLQAHLDMVPQRITDTVHDFSPRIRSNLYRRRVGKASAAPSLAADNGIGDGLRPGGMADDSVEHSSAGSAG